MHNQPWLCSRFLRYDVGEISATATSSSSSSSEWFLYVRTYALDEGHSLNCTGRESNAGGGGRAGGRVIATRLVITIKYRYPAAG